MIVQSGVYRLERDMSFWEARVVGKRELVRPLALSLDKTRLEPTGPWRRPTVTEAFSLTWYGPTEITGVKQSFTARAAPGEVDP